MTAQNPGTELDWQDIHRRLADAAARLERAVTPDPAMLTKTLRDRAIALARVKRPPPDAGLALHFLEFALGTNRFGLDAAFLTEVTGLPAPPLPVPGAPPGILGIVSLRGQVLPVLDLYHRLALADPDSGSSDRLIVLARNAERVGLLVDRIIGFNDTNRAALAGSIPVLARQNTLWRVGVTPNGVTILDPNAFFSTAPPKTA